MNDKEIINAVGVWVKAPIGWFDSEVRFKATSAPEIGSEGGSFTWSAQTANATSWEMIDGTTLEKILQVDTIAKTVSIGANYTFDASNVTSINTVVTPVTPYAAIANDVIFWDCTASNMVVDLPAAASSTNVRIDIKKIDVTANTLTVDPNGAELIDGGPDAVLTTQWEAISIVCDGTAWYIVASL